MEVFQFISERDGPQAALTLILLLIWGQCSPAPLKRHRKKEKHGETWKNLWFCAFSSLGMSCLGKLERGPSTMHPHLLQSLARKASVALVDTISCCWDLCLLGLLASLPSSQVLWGHSPQFASLTDPEVRLKVGSCCTGMVLGMGCQARACLVPP